MRRWDTEEQDKKDFNLPDDTVINMKWCKRCGLGIQVTDDNAHIWAFCYMCGDPLKWYDKDKEFPPD